MMIPEEPPPHIGVPWKGRRCHLMNSREAEKPRGCEHWCQKPGRLALPSPCPPGGRGCPARPSLQGAGMIGNERTNEAFVAALEEARRMKAV